MKNKGLLITTILFFLIVNTTYYWEGILGAFTFPAFALLAIVYLILTFALLRQIYFLIKGKFADRQRFFVIGLLIIVLALTFFKPFGLIDFDKLEGKDLLVAEREGTASCMTRLKLKDNFTFKDRRVCFGVSETKGIFHIQNDTIFFDSDSYYEFAVIMPSGIHTNGTLSDLVMFKNLADTMGIELRITKNDLYKLQTK